MVKMFAVQTNCRLMFFPNMYKCFFDKEKEKEMDENLRHTY